MNYAQNKAYRLRNKAAGLCRYCSKPTISGLVACTDCRSTISKYNKESRDTWANTGMCISCGSERVDTKKTCEKCYLHDIANKSLGSSTYSGALKELLEGQKYKCALTGDDLHYQNMELDHIIPVSRGGSKTMCNVRWVTKDANRAKQAMLDADFIDMCRRIIKHNTK